MVKLTYFRTTVTGIPPPVSPSQLNGRVTAQSTPEKSVLLTHAITPAATRALYFGRAYTSPQLKATQPGDQQPCGQTVVPWLF